MRGAPTRTPSSPRCQSSTCPCSASFGSACCFSPDIITRLLPLQSVCVEKSGAVRGARTFRAYCTRVGSPAFGCIGRFKHQTCMLEGQSNNDLGSYYTEQYYCIDTHSRNSHGSCLGIAVCTPKCGQPGMPHAAILSIALWIARNRRSNRGRPEDRLATMSMSMTAPAAGLRAARP